MELLGDMLIVESCFSPFEDSVSVGARQLQGLCQTYHMLRNHFGRTRWHSKMLWLKYKLNSVRLGRLVILTQDRSTVRIEHTIGSEIALDAPDRTLR
jgi:hypothetical protein